MKYIEIAAFKTAKLANYFRNRAVVVKENYSTKGAPSERVGAGGNFQFY